MEIYNAMNAVDCIIKHGIKSHKIHVTSKNIRSISFYVLKISMVHKKIDLMYVVAWIFS